MSDRTPSVKPCEVRMTFHYDDGTYKSVTVVGEERRNCPVTPERLEKYRKFKEAREQAIREAEAQRRSA